jgi:hypothetical protein
MILQRRSATLFALFFCMILASASSAGERFGFFSGARFWLLSQLGRGYASMPYGGYRNASGFGSNMFSVAGYAAVGGYGYSPYGYGVRNGQVGSGYQSAAGLYSNAFRAGRPQTTTDFQPLMSAITSLPGWNAPVHRVRHRLDSQTSASRPPPFDETGKIVWPSSIPEDSATDSLRRVADDAVKGVFLEWKSHGHASIRPVIDTKKKILAFKHKVLPAVWKKNATDGFALETFFGDLDKALDVLTFRY